MTAHPFNEFVWLLRRIDDVLLGAWQTRHEAIGAAVRLQNEDWYTPIRKPVAEVPITDIRVYENLQ